MPDRPDPSAAQAHEAYRAFEHAGWENAAARYEAAFAGATRPYVPLLLDAAGAAPGKALLDVACGTGVCAREAAARGAVAAGIDFSAAMIETARRLHRGIAFHVGDAEALPFADRTFDAVAINFGAHHFPDPAAALREARRVTRAGGRIAFTDWIAGGALTEADRAMMWKGIAAQSVQSINQYLALLKATGFAEVRVVNLSALWVPILRERLAMYRRMREEACIGTGIDSQAEYVAFYEAFVGLVEKGALGGARFAGVRQPEGWSTDAALLLTKRAGGLSSHAGQWELPGGRILLAYYVNGIAEHQRYHMGAAIWDAPAP